MKRRTMLRYSIYASAGATLIPSFHACKTEEAVATTSTFFDADGMRLITSICDGLIPETDTPGAVSLGVPEFYDHMVKVVFASEDQDRIKEDISLLRIFMDQSAEGGSFDKLSTEDKSALLAKLEETWAEENSLNQDEKAAYYSLRGQAISYYLNTEYVGTKLLNHLPVPGAYEPCIPISQTNGKAWTI